MGDTENVSNGELIDVNEVDKEVKAPELARSLDVAASTIRKYAGILEKAGYNFKKNNDGHWIFVERDAKIFSDMIFYKSKPGITLEVAATIALTQNVDKNELTQAHENVQGLVIKDESQIATKDDVAQNTKQIESLAEIISQQSDEIKLLSEKLSIAVDYIQKQEEQNQKQPKGIWQRLLGK